VIKVKEPRLSRPVARSVAVGLAVSAVLLAGCTSTGDEPPAATQTTVAPRAAEPTTTLAAPTTTRAAGSGTTSAPAGSRVAGPQAAADQLVYAWLDGDRDGARKLTTEEVVDRLFAEQQPANTPANRPPSDPCSVSGPGRFVCGYLIAPNVYLTVNVRGGASAGYRVTGIQWGFD
jgi:predicted lipid-binding transport protein (Tim44 family)